MGDERASNLKALEALLDDFFAPSTNNTRKAEIEKMLKNFSDQNTAWKDCLYFLTESSNHYVCMFSLTTLETIIHQVSRYANKTLILIVHLIILEVGWNVWR